MPSATHPCIEGRYCFDGKGINCSYAGKAVWASALDIHIVSGERIALHGNNGSGKTTLVKLVLGKLQQSYGTVYRANLNAAYIDQDYSLINNALSVYGQVSQFNDSALQEHELKIRLSRFLFTAADWEKSCSSLSGGERMRLLLCCLTIGSQLPDMIVLDEPTNNLDVKNIGILTAAIQAYQGTLLVISHDGAFLEEVGVERSIQL